MIQVPGIYEHGRITLFAPLPKAVAKVLITVVEEPDTQLPQPAQVEQTKRIPGLNRGAYFMADDFDAPLSDAFWLGEA